MMKKEELLQYEEVEPMPDEIEGIKIAQEEIARGEIYTHEEVFGQKAAV